MCARRTCPRKKTPDGRTSSPFRRRGRLRADDGKLEPARGRYLPRLAGPRSGLRWIDIGCGSGAFTEIDPPPNTHPMSALVRKRRFGRARYRLKSRQTADQKCLAKTRGGHRGGHMRLIFGAIVGRALHRVGPNSERFGYLQDTHTLRKLLSHLPSCR